MVRKINGWWVDGSGNKWNLLFYSKEKADALSSSLLACSHCRNCSYCSNCSDCSDCSNCHNCHNCNDCHDCHNCSFCSEFKTGPCIYRTPYIGFPKTQTTMYWLDDNVQIVCGCFRGNLDKFESKVNDVHGNNEHGKAYLKQIAIMRMLVNQDNE